MNSNNVIETLKEKIVKGEEISPFLFLGSNLELLHSQIEHLGKELLQDFGVPEVGLKILHDDGEAIKIKDIKHFLVSSELKTPYKFQLFLIENVSRMTLTSYNSCLKFFEEPGVQNIVFLTNKSESGILDTILSRVQKIEYGLNLITQEDVFFFSLLENYLEKNSSEIFSYFFRNRLDKEEYLKFLKNLILYAKKYGVFVDLLQEIHEDVNMIDQNNVNPRGVVDKYLLKIKKV